MEYYAYMYLGSNGSRRCGVLGTFSGFKDAEDAAVDALYSRPVGDETVVENLNGVVVGRFARMSDGIYDLVLKKRIR